VADKKNDNRWESMVKVQASAYVDILRAEKTWLYNMK
jgi:hypothetical protein